jgi:predicted ribosome quality control (RQC) complex YloA/Tae2 family protein
MTEARPIQPKRSMTSFDIAAELAELSPKLEGIRVENVYQIDPKTILLRARPLDIVAEGGRRLHSTRYRLKTPAQPTQFCRVLRKHLNNGIIRSISQPEFERIVVLETRAGGESYRLTIELFGRGNLILTDSRGTILQALEHRRMRDRSIVPGGRLVPPPPSGLNPLKLTRQDLEQLRKVGEQAVRVLARKLSLGGLYAQEVLSRAGVPGDTRCSSLTEEQMDGILAEINSLATKLAERRFDPCIVAGSRGEWLDVLPFHLSVYTGMITKPYQSFDEALDEYFTKQTLLTQAEGVRGEHEDRLREQERIRAQQEEQLSAALKEAAELRSTANAILQQAGDLQSLLQYIRGQRDLGRDWQSIEESLRRGDVELGGWASLARNLDPSRSTVTVKAGEREIQLDTRRTAYENAGAYFQRAKEMEERARGIRSAMEQTRSRITALEKTRAEKVETKIEPEKRPKREWYQAFRWCVSSEGFLIVGGRDAGTNEALIKKHTSPTDLVFHSDSPGAPFVVVKTENRQPGEITIREAAELASSYSRAWRENAAAVDVYWVKPEQVSPQAPSGEYMARGMFMIYGSRNYMRGIPLRVAVGVLFEEEAPRVIGGPPSAVKSKTSILVEIVPGREQSGRLAKRIRDALIRRSPEQHRRALAVLPLEEIQAFIPAGGGEIALK